MFHESHFWFYLMNLSESLAHFDPHSPESVKQLKSQLASLEEIFGPGIDPVKELDKFSVLSLCGSIRRILAADSPADPSGKTWGTSE